MLAVWTDKGDDFNKLRKNLTSSRPWRIVSSGAARMFPCMPDVRGDDPYVNLNGVTETIWLKGYDKHSILSAG